MIWMVVGTIYGVGLGLTLMGGFIYLIVLTGLREEVNLWKLSFWTMIWPITWPYVAYKLWRMHHGGI